MAVANIVDLFCGVGGLSLGAARAGLVVRGAVDIDPQAIEAHARNFPSAVHLNADLSGFTGQRLSCNLNVDGQEITGIIGGPPCQGFSIIGKRDQRDIRNRAFVQFFRIVSQVLPRFFLVENVPGILHKSYRTLREYAISHVGKCYTILPPMELAANEYGAATIRKRVFFFGYLRDTMKPLALTSFKAPPGVETVYVRDALAGLPIRIDPCWQKEEQGWHVVHVQGDGEYAQRLHGHIPPGVGDQIAIERLNKAKEASGSLGTRHSPEVATRYARTQRGTYDPVSKSYRLDPNGFCPTLRAGTGPGHGRFQAVRPIHPTEPRVITPREAARLQGFPDWFQFSSTKWHSFRQIGNSVSPLLAEKILRVVAEAMDIKPPRRR